MPGAKLKVASLPGRRSHCEDSQRRSDEGHNGDSEWPVPAGRYQRLAETAGGKKLTSEFANLGFRHRSSGPSFSDANDAIRPSPVRRHAIPKPAASFPRRAPRSPMSFLKKFFRNVFRDGSPVETTNGFQKALGRAVGSPSRRRSLRRLHADRESRSPVVRTTARSFRRRATRRDVYFDEESKTSVPVLMGDASKENGCSTRSSTCLDPLGFEVDVVLETSHNRRSQWPRRSVPRAYRSAGAEKHLVRL